MVFVQPGLEHQHIPQVILPASPPGKMFLPVPPDKFGIKEAFTAKAAFVQQRLSPVAQGAAKPGVEWDAKAELWTLHQLARDIAIQHLA
jgi:hypothetical protein